MADAVRLLAPSGPDYHRKYGRPFGVPVNGFRNFDFERGEISDFIDECREFSGLAHAFGMMEALAEGKNYRTAGGPRSLYVMGIEDRDDIAKIGVSANAFRRVEDIQGSHYSRVRLYGVMFFPTRKSETVEQGVLREAQERGDRLMGEWIKARPADVFRAAMEYARDNKIPVTDGMTWFEDMRDRTLELGRRRNRR